ncbi:MAG: ABC transporter ATP-binding protein [Vicinamibacterales bacterium]
MSSEGIVIDVRDLSKCYEIYSTPRDRLRQLAWPPVVRAFGRVGSALGAWAPRAAPLYFREFWALRDVCFQVRRGETLGIIGRNGSGKSTLLQILAGTLTPTDGDVNVVGRVAALLELGAGFNPEFSGHDNVFMNGRLLGLTQAEIEARYDQIVAFADIGPFIDEPVKTYSSGMFVRLAFAVQAHIDASIVIIDEALAVGDVFFTQKCFSRLRHLIDSGVAVVLVTHDLATVTQFCGRVLLLNEGRALFEGEPVSAIRRYLALQREVGSTADPRSDDARGPSNGRPELPPTPGASWPRADAFLDISMADVLGNGQAELLRVALCGLDGEPSRVFEMGDSADFFTEYAVLDDIDVPIGGVTLVTEKGVLLHGKNSLQYRIKAPDRCPRGTTLRFRQRIVLDVAPGEYTFVVGLATAHRTVYDNIEHMSHGDLSSSTRRILSAGRVGAFAVSFRRTGLALTHHGLANLPGECELAVIHDPQDGR